MLHHLRRVAGPLERLTVMNSGYAIMHKSFHLAVFEAHERYGPVVRLAPNRIVSNAATALRETYQNDQGKERV